MQSGVQKGRQGKARSASLILPHSSGKWPAAARRLRNGIECLETNGVLYVGNTLFTSPPHHTQTLFDTLAAAACHRHNAAPRLPERPH